MCTARLHLNWWPPVDEPIGDERAADLVHRLRKIAGPVVDDAERDLRSRIDPGADVIRSGAPASWMARHRFSDPEVQSLCVGTVYQAKGNPGAMNSIQLMRDGTLTWRRE